MDSRQNLSIVTTILFHMLVTNGGLIKSPRALPSNQRGWSATNLAVSKTFEVAAPLASSNLHQYLMVPAGAKQTLLF